MRARRAQPRARTPTAPPSPTRAAAVPPSTRRTCPPHCGAPIGRGRPGVRYAGASGLVLRTPTSPSARLCCARSPPPPEWSLPLPSLLAFQTSSRPWQRSPGPSAAPARALFSWGGAEAFLPGDTGWWAWCSPHCGLYGSPRRTKGVHAALVPRSRRPPTPIKDERKTLFSMKKLKLVFWLCIWKRPLVPRTKGCRVGTGVADLGSFV